MTTHHVLPGDANVAQFRETGIAGEVVVCRECLVDGPRSAVIDDAFFDARAAFVADGYGADPVVYSADVRDEILRIRDAAEVNFWFENELFCQVNFWFCLALVENGTSEFYRVAPRAGDEVSPWNGFSRHTADDLKECFAERVRLTPEDVALGARLWRAFAGGDRIALVSLGRGASRPAFPFLGETTKAAANIEIDPQRVVDEIVASGKTKLSEVFPEFSSRLGVYGYGDAQVARLMRHERR